ncbi:MAG: DivIVA domain-containing protein [Erysipelotrichaceae bacterium]|nr:DivIVA domain-containing protein [Erysipelotrichaceae bacterium]
MAEFKNQWRGYNKQEVDNKVNDLNNTISNQQQQIVQLQQEIQSLKDTNTELTKQITIQEKTNEEIARLALKEASDLIEKAKRNANMILKESMEYVRGLSKDVDSIKQEALDFRASVVKLSEEMIETIDKSEIFSLIKEEQENKYDEGESS